MRSLVAATLVVLGGAGLAACVAGDARFAAADPAGFWSGLWHGLIAPIAFVVGWFSDVEIYERTNNGGWYDFGYLLGLTCLWGGSRQTRRWWKNGNATPTPPPCAPHLPKRVTIDVDWTDRQTAAGDAATSGATGTPGATADDRSG